MPNTNTTTNIVATLLAQGALALRERAILPMYVNRAYEERAGEQFSTMDIPIPSAITAQAVTPSYTPPDDAGVSPTKVSVTLDQWYEAPFFLNDKEMLEVLSGTIPMQASEAIRALANNVNAAVANTYKGVYGYAGTAGTTPFATDLTEFNEADQVLNDQLAPEDPRFVLLNSKAYGNARGLRQIGDASWRGNPELSRTGKVGEFQGYMWDRAAGLPRHTAGTITTGLTAKSATAQALDDKTIVCTTAASTGACALVEGDIVTFGTDTQTYVLTAAATQASANSDVTLNIEPGLKVALAGGEAVAVKSSHRVNLVGHRDAIALVSRPFAGADPLGIGLYQSTVDPVSKLALRLEVTRQHKRTRFSYDILYGVKLVRREGLVRLAGE